MTDGDLAERPRWLIVTLPDAAKRSQADMLLEAIDGLDPEDELEIIAAKYAALCELLGNNLWTLKAALRLLAGKR